MGWCDDEEGLGFKMGGGGDTWRNLGWGFARGKMGDDIEGEN